MLAQNRHLTSRGCLACVKRKVKCDQTKPSCEKCTRRARPCPGYRSISDLSFRNTVVFNGPANRAVAAQNVLFSPRTYEYYSPNGLCPNYGIRHNSEANALYYFRTLATDDFSGWLLSDFWTRTVYQLCQNDPSIRLAVVAVSEAHRERTFSAANLSSSTLTQYGRAIRSTVAGPQERNTYKTYFFGLFSCVLLYYFELLNENTQSANAHLDNGLGLLREWFSLSKVWPPAEAQVGRSTAFLELLYTIGRLDLDRMLRGACAESSAQVDLLIENGLKPVTDKPTDLFHLKTLLLLLSRQTLRFARTNAHLAGMHASQVPYDALVGRRLLLSRVENCEASMESFQGQIDTKTASGRMKLMAVCIMRLYLISNRVRLENTFSTEENALLTPYDDYAKEMLIHADMAVDLRNDGLRNESYGRQHFMPEAGIIAPLQRIIKCASHQGLQSRARAIIARLNHIEGLYN